RHRGGEHRVVRALPPLLASRAPDPGRRRRAAARRLVGPPVRVLDALVERAPGPRVGVLEAADRRTGPPLELEAPPALPALEVPVPGAIVRIHATVMRSRRPGTAVAGDGGAGRGTPRPGRPGSAHFRVGGCASAWRVER